MVVVVIKVMKWERNKVAPLFTTIHPLVANTNTTTKSRIPLRHARRGISCRLSHSVNPFAWAKDDWQSTAVSAKLEQHVTARGTDPKEQPSLPTRTAHQPP